MKLTCERLFHHYFANQIILFTILHCKLHKASKVYSVHKAIQSS